MSINREVGEESAAEISPHAKATSEKVAGVFIFVVITAATLIWRFVAFPWDSGNFLFHAAISAFAGSYLVCRCAQLTPGSRMLANYAVLPLAVVAAGASLWLAAQSLFPLVALGVSICVASWAMAGHFRWLVMITICAVGLSLVWCQTTIRHAYVVYTLKRLRAEEIAAIWIMPMGEAGVAPRGAVELTTEQAKSNIAAGIADLSPRSLNHERIPNGLCMRVRLHSGREVTFDVASPGSGNGEKVWIMIGGSVYQSSGLGRVLFDQAGIRL